MPSWCFDTLKPDEMERNPVSEDFFANGTRLEAVIRESLQNSLDASNGGSDPVEVRIYFSGEGDKLPPEKLKPYFNGGEHRFEDPQNGLVSPLKVMSGDCRFLVIEDFHTTGLTGITDERPIEEDANHRNDWNYYNYFFRENGSSKVGASTLGSWGAGKCVFQRASRLKCSFTYSVRDGYEPRAFVFGKATLKHHTDADHHTWKPDGWFGVKGNDPSKMQKLPITDATFIAKFREDFNILRKDEPGTSIVIPYINLSEGSENEEAEFNQHNLVRSVLRNFLVAINNGALNVRVKVGKNGAETVVNKANVHAYKEFLPRPEERDALVTQLHHDLILKSMDLPESQKFTLASPGEYPQWGKTMFDENQLKTMRKLLQEEKKSCCITVPVPIRKKTADGRISTEEGRFSVLLKREALPKSLPSVFYRVGLLIDDVSTEKWNSYIASVLIERGALADLLVAAEPPSHNKWNSSTDRVAREYEKPRNHIVYVSHSVREIINMLATFDQERNYDPLSDVFGIKKDKPKSRNNGGNKADSGSGGNDAGDAEPPQSEKKRIVELSEINGTVKGIKIKAGEGLSNEPDEKFPFKATFHIGYDTFRGLDWSPNDFMLDNGGTGGVALSVTEGTVEARGRGNKVILTIKDKAPFCVIVTGFDPNRDVIAEKVKYVYNKEEGKDGVSV